MKLGDVAFPNTYTQNMSTITQENSYFRRPLWP